MKISKIVLVGSLIVIGSADAMEGSEEPTERTPLVAGSVTSDDADLREFLAQGEGAPASVIDDESPDETAKGLESMLVMYAIEHKLQSRDEVVARLSLMKNTKPEEYAKFVKYSRSVHRVRTRGALEIAGFLTQSADALNFVIQVLDDSVAQKQMALNSTTENLAEMNRQLEESQSMVRWRTRMGVLASVLSIIGTYLVQYFGDKQEAKS